MAFTDLQIKRLKPRDTAYDVTETGVSSDRRGLMIRVFPTGSKTWVFRYSIKKKTRRMTLGNYPDMGIAEAHAKQLKNRSLLNDDKDPADQRQKVKEERDEKEAEERNTVQMLADEWMTRYVKKERKNWREVQRILDKDVLPAWGKRRAASIKPRQVVLLLDKITDRGAKVQANRTYSVLKQMFKFGVSRGIVPGSPCVATERPLKKEPSRERVLTDAEIKRFWKKLDTAKMLPMMRYIYRLVLVTGQRPGEVSRAEWSEFDLEQKLWTIPGEKTKNGKTHEVPLSKMALELLEGLRTEREDETWLFPGRKKGAAHPIEEKAAARAMRNNRDHFGITNNPYTPHDLRRTVRTNLSKLGIDPIVAKKVVNHSLGGMDAVYDRYDYTPEKTRALDAWANHLKAIIDGKKPKVSPIRKAS